MLRWVVYLAVCAIVWAIDQALTARRARVQTSAQPSTLLQSMRRCGVAPAAPLLPPDGNWCRCCGRPCPEPWLWCDDCLFHIRLGPTSLHDQTWYAQHGPEDLAGRVAGQPGDEVYHSGDLEPGQARNQRWCCRMQHGGEVFRRRSRVGSGVLVAQVRELSRVADSAAGLPS